MTSTMTDEEMAKDLLSNEKFINSNYNTFTNECTDEQVHGDFVNMLQRSHGTQHQMFKKVQENGWYQVKPAPPNEVQQVKQKFSEDASS